VTIPAPRSLCAPAPKGQGQVHFSEVT
jgi:hypothetical protein